jgi:folate-binding protein YgfZ
MASAVLPAVPDCIMNLDDLGVIQVDGDDASSFLQGQLTCDVALLKPGFIQPGAWCSAKGRILASFLIWTDGLAFFFALPRELLDPVKKRLGMFVLRAKVKLQAPELVLRGIAGSGAQAPLGSLFGALPAAIWSTRHGNAGLLARLPDSMGQPRWLAAVPAAQLAAFEGMTAALAPVNAATWRWMDVRAGLPTVVTATQDKFVPQMINFEALGGVSFKKGCYPGQEVVARSQYLGKLKRRTLLAHAAADAAPLAGSDVLDASGAPIGIIVNAEQAPSGGVDLLVQLPLDARGSALSLPGGTALSWLELPYDLPDNEPIVRPKL